jgi:hypothetical protein
MFLALPRDQLQGRRPRAAAELVPRSLTLTTSDQSPVGSEILSDSLLFLTYNAFVVDHVDGNQCEKRTTKLYWWEGLTQVQVPEQQRGGKESR